VQLSDWVFPPAVYSSCKQLFWPRAGTERIAMASSAQINEVFLLQFVRQFICFLLLRNLVNESGVTKALPASSWVWPLGQIMGKAPPRALRILQKPPTRAGYISAGRNVSSGKELLNSTTWAAGSSPSGAIPSRASEHTPEACPKHMGGHYIGQFLKSCNLCATFGVEEVSRQLLAGKKIWADPETTEDQPKANKRRSSATGLTVPKELSRGRGAKFKLRGCAPLRSIPQKL